MLWRGAQKLLPECTLSTTHRNSAPRYRRSLYPSRARLVGFHGQLINFPVSVILHRHLRGIFPGQGSINPALKGFPDGPPLAGWLRGRILLHHVGYGSNMHAEFYQAAFMEELVMIHIPVPIDHRI